MNWFNRRRNKNLNIPDSVINRISRVAPEIVKPKFCAGVALYVVCAVIAISIVCMWSVG